MSHLPFYDNALFFLKASQLNLLRMNRILNLYCKAPGQAINFDKSSMVFDSITSETIRLACYDVFVLIQIIV